jgi:hypothetical protein
MTTTTPVVQAPRVRPLWERDELFREPQYQDGALWEGEDDTDDEPSPEVAS